MGNIQPRKGLTGRVMVRPLRGRDPVGESVSVGFTYGYSRCCPSGKREERRRYLAHVSINGRTLYSGRKKSLGVMLTIFQPRLVRSKSITSCCRRRSGGLAESFRVSSISASSIVWALVSLM